MHNHVILGGTFDHIHKGHVALLTRAFFEGRHVTIGLTTDAYIRNVKCQMSNVKSYKIRKKQLEEWLKKQEYVHRSTIVSIDDSYGPSISSLEYDAIVVSKETEKTAKKINSERTKQEVSPLSIIVIPMVPAEDAQRISSTRIRNGEIDHDGRLILPEVLRETLTHPIGTIIFDKEPISVPERNTTIISIGDTTTETLLSQGIVPTLACIDFQAQRQAFDWKKELWDKLTKRRTVSYFQSGPGFINKKVMKAIDRWSDDPKPSLYIIDGEEDLLVLPAILYAPQGSIVYYGQPHKGIIRVLVSQKTKHLVQKLLSQFTCF